MPRQKRLHNATGSYHVMLRGDTTLLTGGISHPFRFSGKELDRQNGLNWYDFGARWFDVAGVPMWTSVDPLAEKYYHVTPYSYCAGNPVNKFNPDGREVRNGVGEYNQVNAELRKLSQDLAEHNDPNSIMIVAHGVKEEGKDLATEVNIRTYNEDTRKWNDNYISDGKQLSNLLSKCSKTWQNYEAGNIEAKDLKIILYACSSAEVAKNISSDPQFKDITVIAPSKDIGVSNKSQVVVGDLKRVQNDKGEWVSKLDTRPGKGPGVWSACKNGRYISNYSGNENLKPGTKGFEY